MKLVAPIHIDAQQYVVEIIRKADRNDPIFMTFEGGKRRRMPIPPNTYICVHPDINKGEEFAVQLNPETIGSWERMN